MGERYILKELSAAGSMHRAYTENDAGKSGEYTGPRSGNACLCPEAALQLKETIAASFNCTEIWITEFSPLMGYATGTGALGLAFYRAD